MSKLTPPCKWHGGKHYLAPKIVALMPPHVHYVEPFAGGLSVLLAKDPEGVSEVVNDINGALANFWKVIACRVTFPEFRRIVEATPFSEEIWRDAGLLLDSTAGMQAERAAAFFVRCRQSLAGRMKKASFAPLSKARTRGGMNEQASAWITAVEGLPAVHERLRRVVVQNRDALKVIRNEDHSTTLFYLDPPYLHETRKTTDDYENEMSEDQHMALLGTLAEVKGKFILSGYDSSLYQDAARTYDWRRVDFELPNNAAGGTSKRRMTESVWCNFDPLEAP